jgi:hypothetical protein
MFTRKVEPVGVWQSMHWQMVTGLTSASKLIQPQWHVVDLHAFCPGIDGGSVMCELPSGHYVSWTPKMRQVAKVAPCP